MNTDQYNSFEKKTAAESSTRAAGIGMLAKQAEGAQNEIPQALGDIESSLNRLFNEIACLENKLSPVCASPNPSNAGGRPYPAMDTSVGKALVSLQQRIDDATDYVVGLTCRTKL